MPCSGAAKNKSVGSGVRIIWFTFQFYSDWLKKVLWLSQVPPPRCLLTKADLWQLSSWASDLELGSYERASWRRWKFESGPGDLAGFAEEGGKGCSSLVQASLCFLVGRERQERQEGRRGAGKNEESNVRHLAVWPVFLIWETETLGWMLDWMILKVIIYQDYLVFGIFF